MGVCVVWMSHLRLNTPVTYSCIFTSWGSFSLLQGEATLIRVVKFYDQWIYVHMYIHTHFILAKSRYQESVTSFWVVGQWGSLLAVAHTLDCSQNLTVRSYR